MAGGGPLLTDVVPYDATRHVAANLAALVERSLDLPAGSVRGASRCRRTRSSAHRAARSVRGRRRGRRSRNWPAARLPASLLALHAPGGRAIKQWPVERFAEAASRLAREMDASVVLTGGPDDRAIVDEAESRLAAAGVRTLRLDGPSDLVILAGILAQCRLLLTGDTGPMHLAAAVGTPVVAVFGPSMPWRYAPLAADHRIVRVDLPCSPCNRIRQPPERCVGTHARLPRWRHHRYGRRGGARLAGVHPRHPAPMTSRAVPGTRARLGTGPGALSVDALIAPEDAERAEADANHWIKSLRHARVDGATFRDRFTHRGDSLWWFAEIYLHKRRIIVRALRALYALRQGGLGRRVRRHGTSAAWTTSSRTSPRRWHARHGISCEGISRGAARADRLTQAAKAFFHTSTAMADRLRVRSAPPATRGGVAAFVHSAFARGGAGEEAYIGPVLRAIELRVGAAHLSLVGLGPRTSFSVRGWRDRLREFADPDFRDLAVTPVDAYSGWRELAPSRSVWRSRRQVAKALTSSHDLREAAAIDGCDLWPLVSAELEGIAELQFPWSARAMDEAGAALDHLSPDAVVTYAEAGGWGRALVLESRRRRIPVAATQHGLIYRHWLNYLHEPDEILPSDANPADSGFPSPDRTLLFDDVRARAPRARGTHSLQIAWR